jgi:Uma2 family endonuclease
VVASPQRWAVDWTEYLRFEREAAERHELIEGEIVAMAGATRRHNLLCGRLHDVIRPPLGDGPCILERSDQRLGVLASSKGWVGYYPDLAVYCSDEVHPDDADTRIHPAVLVEVTSKSTEGKDRGVKLDDYLQIPSLDQYIIVSHQRTELEIWTKGSGGWTRQLATSGRTRLARGAEIDVDVLYANLPT